MRQHRNDGAELGDAYVGGRGSALVLLHGLTGTWHIWKPIIALLEPHHRVIAVTLPGHHRGPGLTGDAPISIGQLADAVIANLTQRGIDSAHVVGNSIGGWLALELARRGFAHSVTALSPAGGWSNERDLREVAQPFRVFYYLVPVLLLLLGAFLWIPALRRALARQTMERADRIPAIEFIASIFAVARTRILLPLLRSFERLGPYQPLPSAQPPIPIRIAWGACDRVIPFERYGRTMVERTPQAELVMVGHVGHVPMYDEPERIAELILEVTRGVDAKVSEAVA